jgi:hypothetical protein
MRLEKFIFNSKHNASCKSDITISFYISRMYMLLKDKPFSKRICLSRADWNKSVLYELYKDMKPEYLRLLKMLARKEKDIKVLTTTMYQYGWQYKMAKNIKDYPKPFSETYLLYAKLSNFKRHAPGYDIDVFLYSGISGGDKYFRIVGKANQYGHIVFLYVTIG